MHTIERLDTNATLQLDQLSFHLSRQELQIVIDHSSEWKPDTTIAPGDYCHLVYEALKYKYGDDLLENDKKKLAAKVLKMNYFQYSDLFFQAKKDAIKKQGRNVYNPEHTKIGRLHTALDIEKQRLKTEALSGQKIDPKDFLVIIKKQKEKERIAAIYAGVSSEKLKDIEQFFQEYQASKVKAVAINTKELTEENLSVGKTKVGGLPSMLPTEDLPKDDEGRPMKMIFQVNLDEMASLLGKEAVPHNGLLVFYLAQSGYEFIKEGCPPFEIRYYPDTNDLFTKDYEDPSNPPHPTIDFSLSIKDTYAKNPHRPYILLKNQMKGHEKILLELLENLTPNPTFSFLGHSSNSFLCFLNFKGKDLIERIDDYIPLVYMRSILCKSPPHHILFGDAGSVAFFIKKESWRKGDFTEIALGFYD